MANHCLFTIEVTGSPATLERIYGDDCHEGANEKMCGTEECPLNMVGCIEGTDPRWVITDIASITADHLTLILRGSSAWNPPIDLLKRFCAFHQVNANMVYAESGNGLYGYVDATARGRIRSEQEYDSPACATDCYNMIDDYPHFEELLAPEIDYYLSEAEDAENEKD